MRVVAKASALLILLASSGLPAKDNRSLTDFESGPGGTVISVPSAGALDQGSLEEQLVLVRSSVKALTDSLATANADAETYKRKAEELQVRLDAYGLTGLDKEPEKVELRLLSAVRDLRVLKKQNEDAKAQLVQLFEAIQVLIKTADGISPEMRMSVETEMRKTREVLGATNVPKPAGTDVTITDAIVVDVKEDLSLVVANVGSKQGVKIGMPFQIVRGSEQIADVRVVDVRERICGAVIQNLKSIKMTVKKGDNFQAVTR